MGENRAASVCPTGASWRRTLARSGTWHHPKDVGIMQPIPIQIHDAVHHSGGVAAWVEAIGVKCKP